MKLSIIIPVFNVERYLRTCLDSVVQQGLDDYEVIMIDDGSTDGSPRICDEYAARHPHFFVFHQENQGISAVRNRGIKEAQGEYVVFLDSDDFWVAGMLSGLVKLASSNNLDVLGFKLTTVTDDCRETSIERQEVLGNVDVISGIEFIANNNYVAQIWWYIFRCELIEGDEMMFPVGHLLEEAAFNIRLFSKAQRVAQVPNVFYCYRIHTKSIMHNRDKEHQKRLLWDYLYAACDVDRAMKDAENKMNEACYERCRSRRDSYVFFGAIKAFKLGMVKEFFASAKEKGLYPFKGMSKTDYPGIKFTALHWCIQHPWLWKTLGSIYRILR